MSAVVLLAQGHAGAAAEGGSAAAKLRNSGITAIQGTIVRSGQPTKGTAALIVYPTQQVLRSYGTGVAVPLRYEAVAHANSSGRFDLRVQPSQLGADYLNSDGQIDVDVVVNDGSDELTWSTSLSLVATSRGKEWRSIGSDATQASRPSFDVSDGSVLDTSTTSQLHLDARGAAMPAARQKFKAAKVQGGRVVQTAKALMASGDPAGIQSAEACVAGWGGTYQTSSERWGSIYARAKAWDVSLTSGNDHTLGIQYGTGQSGTSTISSSMTSSTTAANAALYNTVRYRSWFNDCYPKEWMKPYNVVTLISSYSQIPSYDYPYCTPGSANVRYSKNRTSNITFGAGVTIKGVGLSARSGWGSGVAMSVFPTSNVWLCGNNSAGWADSNNVSNKPR